MPILECILIDASENEIKLTANDMELGIETKVEGTILEHGKIALDDKAFLRNRQKALGRGFHRYDRVGRPVQYGHFL